MPYISENGELKFVTQAEYNAWNTAQGLPTADQVTGRTSANATAPASGTKLNVAQPVNTNTLSSRERRALVLEQEKQVDAELADVDSKLAQANTGRINLSASEIRALEDRKSQLSDAANTLADGRPVTNGVLSTGRTTTEILLPNTTQNTPGQNIPTTYATANSGTVPVTESLGANEEIIPQPTVTSQTVDDPFADAVNIDITGVGVTETIAEDPNAVTTTSEDERPTFIAEDVASPFAEPTGDVLVSLNDGQELVVDEQGFTQTDEGGILRTPEDVPVEQQGDELVDLNTGEVYGIDPETGFVDSGDELLRSPEDLAIDEQTVPDGGLVEVTEEGSIVRQPEEVSETALYGTPYDDEGNLNPGWELDGDGNPYYVGFQGGKPYINPDTAASAAASRQEATLANARAQAAINNQRRQANEGDWRVKLRLAGGADYLYKDPELNDNGILYPLQVTDGVVFPYTPQITTTYHANYSAYDLTHSNYRGYFYQNSYVGEIQMNATFTAQSTAEANYLLAVIHFFRSVTKMFYGKDAQRGSPPPMVFLQGLGEYQFNLHPCVVSQFNYNLPNDVDYIRARTANLANTQDLLFRRDRQTLPTNPFSGAWERLKNAGLKPGAINTSKPAPATLGTNSPTYVPTKIEVSLVLLPIQTRDQVSKQFSLKQFANGDLLKGGFW